MASFIKSDNHITLVFDDGDTTTVYISDENYGAVCAAIKDKAWDTAKNLAHPVEILKKKIKNMNKVAVQDGCVTYDGIAVHTTLTERMLEMHHNGFDISSLGTFLENLMENTSYRAVNELYNFLEKSNLPITEDGHFLAYKRVRNNFMDIHSGKFDNTPGLTVEIARNKVDEDKNNTCSSGLHFCSRDYLPYFAPDGEEYKVVMIKINPRDVEAIPSDYNDTKGRCCKYCVVSELDIDLVSDGMLPKEKLEGSFKDSRIIVGESEIEQLNLADAVLGEGEPKIIGTFNSPTSAMQCLNIDSSNIVMACDGARNSAGGFAWRWSSKNPLHKLTDEPSEIGDSICYQADCQE